MVIWQTALFPRWGTLKDALLSCPNIAHNAESKQQPAELCHPFLFYLQMLKCYFEVWIVPWLQKAHVPVALCHWPTFSHENVICRGSTIVSFSLSGLLRPKLKWGTAVQNQHRTFLSKHTVGCFYLSLRKMLKIWVMKKRLALTKFIAIQLCISFSETKPQMRTCCHSFTREHFTLFDWDFQAVWTDPGCSVGLALLYDESSCSYDINKPQPQHTELWHCGNLYNRTVCLGIHTHER